MQARLLILRKNSPPEGPYFGLHVKRLWEKIPPYTFISIIPEDSEGAKQGFVGRKKTLISILSVLIDFESFWLDLKTLKIHVIF